MVTPMMPEKQSAVSCGSMDSASVKTVENAALRDHHEEDQRKREEHMWASLSTVYAYSSKSSSRIQQTLEYMQLDSQCLQYPQPPAASRRCPPPHPSSAAYDDEYDDEYDEAWLEYDEEYEEA